MMTGFRFGTWFWITAVENVLMHLFSSPLFWLGVSNGFLILALIMWRLCHIAWRHEERERLKQQSISEPRDKMLREQYSIACELLDQLQRFQVCYAVMEKAYLCAHEGYIYAIQIREEWRHDFLRADKERNAELANYKAMYENAKRRIYEHQAKEALLRDGLERLQLFIVDRAAS